MSLIKIIIGCVLSTMLLLNFGYMAVQTDDVYKFWLIIASVILTVAGMCLYVEGVNK